MIKDILKRCGLFGATDGQITVNYNVKATSKILGFKLSGDFKNQSTNFTCPVNVSPPIAPLLSRAIFDRVGPSPPLLSLSLFLL